MIQRWRASVILVHPHQGITVPPGIQLFASRVTSPSWSHGVNLEMYGTLAQNPEAVQEKPTEVMSRRAAKLVEARV